MYQVTVHHHDKAWRNGDLEDELKLIAQENFKTRKAAVAFIESKISNKPSRQIARYPHRGDKPSNYYWFTGVTWQHENSGEEMAEYYQYTLKKVKLKG
jgi:hypothetical protein